MTPINQITSKLHELSLEELRELNERVVIHIKSRRKAVAKRKRNQFSSGDNVIVTSDGGNKVETGTVRKVNRTRAVVDISGVRYNVPLTMMELAS